jgi:hypothetical protein
MTLEAYVDDSGSEPRSLFFVLGGFISKSDRWPAFSDDWRAAQSKEPAIKYFKFNEALALKGQFDRAWGWDEAKRDRKIDNLIDVILKYAQVRVHATIRHDEFKRHFRSVPTPKRHKAIDNPYVLLAMQLILAVAAWSPIRGIYEPCNFVFDQQGTYGDALAKWYPIFCGQAKATARTDIARYLGKAFQFGDDRHLMPLQAADLYAGLVRRHCWNNKFLIVHPGAHLRRLAAIPEIARDYGSAELMRLNQHLQRVGDRFYAANPRARRLYPHDKRLHRVGGIRKNKLHNGV